jgi:glucokinase
MSGAATRLIAGVDLGGTKISACIATPEGVIARHRQAVPLDGEPGAIAASMRTLLEHCCADGQREWSEIESVGLSACGPFGRDGDGRLTLRAPNLCGGLSGSGSVPNSWQAVALEADCEAWQRPVTIVNDAAAALMAEHRFGRLVGHRDAAYLTWSTGIGFGLMSDGRLLLGKRGNAGHAGHAVPARVETIGTRCGCGNIDDIEALAGGAALERAWGDSAASLFAAARAGEDRARALVDVALDAVSAALYNLIVTLDLERIVIGGSLFFAQRDLLLPGLRDRVFGHPARGGLLVMLEGVEIESVDDPARTAELGALSIVMPGAWPAERFRD